jgi:hypothetical protein
MCWHLIVILVLLLSCIFYSDICCPLVNLTRKLSSGAVVSAKPQLIADHERVSSDTKTGANAPGSVEGKRKIGASNPGPEDAAELLR